MLDLIRMFRDSRASAKPDCPKCRGNGVYLLPDKSLQKCDCLHPLWRDYNAREARKAVDRLVELGHMGI